MSSTFLKVSKSPNPGMGAGRASGGRCCLLTGPRLEVDSTTETAMSKFIGGRGQGLGVGRSGAQWLCL